MRTNHKRSVLVNRYPSIGVLLSGLPVLLLGACDRSDPKASGSATSTGVVESAVAPPSSSGETAGQSSTEAEPLKVKQKAQDQRQDFVVKGFFLGMNCSEAHAAIKATGSDYEDRFIANLALRHDIWNVIEVYDYPYVGRGSLNAVPEQIAKYCVLIQALRDKDMWNWQSDLKSWTAVTGEPEPTIHQEGMTFFRKNDQNIEEPKILQTFPGDMIIAGAADAIALLPMTDPDYEPIVVGVLSTANKAGDILCRFTGQGGVADMIIFEEAATSRLFNSADLSAEEFVQAFINAYHIPEIEGQVGQWQYRDPRGILITIRESKSIVMESVTAKAELKFGG